VRGITDTVNHQIEAAELSCPTKQQLNVARLRKSMETGR
jgi:hypothetical protein